MGGGAEVLEGFLHNVDIDLMAENWLERLIEPAGIRHCRTSEEKTQMILRQDNTEECRT